MPGRADAYFRRMPERSAIEIVWLWAFSKGSDGADTLGQGRIGPAAGHPFAQQLWAWSGAVATCGVNQGGDHAVGGSDNLATARGLRPECSRRPVLVERADVAVAQPVVDQREQFACRGNLGDVLAAAGFDTVFVGRDLGGGLVPLHRLDRRPAD